MQKRKEKCTVNCRETSNINHPTLTILQDADSDLTSAEMDAEKKRKAQFVMQNRAKLIQDASTVMAIVDSLGTTMVHREKYQSILAEKTPIDQMRMLYTTVIDQGATVIRAAFYDALIQHQPDLLENLVPPSSPDPPEFRLEVSDPTQPQGRQTAKKSCPREWKAFGGSCYYRTTDLKTWQEGRDYCLKQQTDLVIINSKEEQDFIRGLRPDTDYGLDFIHYYGSHIGLKSPDGVTWSWVDGTPLTTQYWRRGYPDQTAILTQPPTVGECAYYDHYPDPGVWDNAACSYALYTPVICEKKIHRS